MGVSKSVRPIPSCCTHLKGFFICPVKNAKKTKCRPSIARVQKSRWYNPKETSPSGSIYLHKWVTKGLPASKKHLIYKPKGQWRKVTYCEWTKSISHHLRRHGNQCWYLQGHHSHHSWDSERWGEMDFDPQGQLANEEIPELHEPPECTPLAWVISCLSQPPV